MEGESPRRHHIHHRKEHEAHDEHPEKLQVMITDEGQSLVGICGGLVFPYQSESAQEKENGHAVMAEIREKMQGKELIRMSHHVPEIIIVVAMKLVLVLLHNLAYEVAIIVEHDGQDGDATHGRAFVS